MQWPGEMIEPSPHLGMKAQRMSQTFLCTAPTISLDLNLPKARLNLQTEYESIALDVSDIVSRDEGKLYLRSGRSDIGLRSTCVLMQTC